MPGEKRSMNPSKAIGSDSGSVRRGYTIQSVVRAASIIHAFQSTSEVLDLRVVAGRVGLHKATTFRLSRLRTLLKKRSSVGRWTGLCTAPAFSTMGP